MVTEENTSSGTGCSRDAGGDVSGDVSTDIARLRALLDEERRAIRKLDSASILELAERKQVALARLRAHAAAGLGAVVAEGLRTIVPVLRQNLVLLAHARDCLQGALEGARGEPIAPMLSGGGGGGGLRPGMRISILG